MSWAFDNLTLSDRERIAKECFQVQEERGNELHGLCPAHDDHNTSFSYNTEKDLCNCLACGFKGDLITLWGKANNIGDAKDAFKSFRSAHGETPSPGKGGSADKGKGGAGKPPSTEPEKTLVIPEEEWQKLPPLPEEWRKRCREKFGWSDAVMDMLGLRIRKKGAETRLAIPIRDDQGRLVNVRLYLPGAAENKVISWGKDYGKGKLFPAPPLPPEEPVLLCEGEKDTICALSHGFNAITQTTGVQSWSDRYTRFFSGRKVYIAYDNDEPGRQGAEKAAKKLAEVASSVHIVIWPKTMAEKEDLTDWFITHDSTAEQLRCLLLEAKPVKMPETTTRSRKERAQEIPEDQQRYFIGKQFKARRCADHILEEFKLAYDPVTSSLYQWNGKLWEELHESIIRNRILSLLGDEGNTARVNDVCRVVQDLSIIRHGRKFNDRHDLLPLLNGSLDVKQGKLVKHDPDHLNSYVLDVSIETDPDKMQDCPHWKQFLADSIGDTATIKELQKFFGYCYTRETRYEKALYLIGPGGDGKGTIIKVMRSLLGEVNCSTVSMSDMQDQFHRVMLVDKLLNSTTEIRSELFYSDLLKTLISGEPISASQKHRPAFSFNPVAKHVFSGNSYPDIKDHTDGLYRRLLLIEMDQQFVASGKADPFLYEKLMQEKNGIFLWGLRGLQLLLDEGFTPSEEMKGNLDLFKQKNNPLYGFMLEHVERDDTGTLCKSEDIYKKYREFCSKRGNQPYSLTNVMLMVKQLCPWISQKQQRVGVNRFRGYEGIKLVEWKND